MGETRTVTEVTFYLAGGETVTETLEEADGLVVEGGAFRLRMERPEGVERVLIPERSVVYLRQRTREVPVETDGEEAFPWVTRGSR